MCICVSLSFGTCTFTTGPHCTHSSQSSASVTCVEVADVAGGLPVAVEGVVGHRGDADSAPASRACRRAAERVRGSGETAGRAENLRGRGDEETRAHTDDDPARGSRGSSVAPPALLPWVAAALLAARRQSLRAAPARCRRPRACA